MIKDSLNSTGTIKKKENQTLDNTLFVWFSAERELGVPILGSIIQENALSLNLKIPNDNLNFKSSQSS